jgi:hypothetical protein
MSVMKKIAASTIAGTALIIWIRVGKLALSLHTAIERYRREKSSYGPIKGFKSSEEDIISSLVSSNTYGISGLEPYLEKHETTFESILEEAIDLLSRVLHLEKNAVNESTTSRNIETFRPPPRRVDFESEETWISEASCYIVCAISIVEGTEMLEYLVEQFTSLRGKNIKSEYWVSLLESIEEQGKQFHPHVKDISIGIKRRIEADSTTNEEFLSLTQRVKLSSAVLRWSERYDKEWSKILTQGALEEGKRRFKERNFRLKKQNSLLE